MKLRICFLISGFSDGGAQRQCIFLLNQLQKSPHIDLSLIYFFEGIHFGDLLHTNIDIIKIESSSLYSPMNIIRASKIIAERRPNILITWMHACDVYGYFLRLLNRSVKWVMTERDSSYPFDLRFLLRDILGRYADLIIANSDKGARYWEAKKALNKPVVIPNIVQKSLNDKSVESSTRIDGPVICVGRLEPQKNTQSVVKSFVRVAKLRDNIDFFVIGSGSEEKFLLKIVDEAGLSKRIRFLGFRKDAINYIRSASLVVSMSHHEGLPNVLLESVSCGTTVVASRIPEHVELLGDEYPFLVEDRSDPFEIAKVVDAALSQPKFLDPLDFARKRIAEMTPDFVANRYIDVFLATAGVEK